MDVSSVVDASTALSLSEVQDSAQTLVLKNALDCEREAGQETVQMLNSIPTGHILDQLV